MKKGRKSSVSIVKRIICISLCLFIAVAFYVPVQAEVTASEQSTVRVGFFQADGYHEMDSDGTMSGYGFDFLQMMLRYNDWNYEYVGYDLNWGDMLGKLDSGEIDMVTLANKTPEREEKYSFSSNPIGTSSTIMTINSTNQTIAPGEYDTYNGAVVGLVTNSIHNTYFEEYAAEHGFLYTPRYYESISDLLSDLRSGKNIDVAVTSNMRVLQDEVVLDEFNAQDYYAVVRKDNTKLLKQIDSGIAQLNVYSPNWQLSLFRKYYGNINSKVIALSSEERAYLEELKAQGKVIKAAMNPELRPYAYFEDGVAKGIAPTLFKEIAERLGIEYEILSSADRWEYKNQLNTGEADIDLTAYLDYSLAQRYNLKETDAYIASAIAMLSRADSNTDRDTMTIAVVKDPTEYIGYNNELIYQYHYKEYDSIQQCIDAVKNKEVDATFRYVYIAECAVAEDYTNTLKYTIMPNYPFNMAIGVNNQTEHKLLSILNKGVNSLTDDYTQGVMLEETSNIQQSMTFLAFAYSNPGLMVLFVIFILLFIFSMLLLIVRNRNQKMKLAASREMQRFISYICESYDLVTEVNLKKNLRSVYQMIDGHLEELHTVHQKLDEEYFRPIVKGEDFSRITEAFSEDAIRKMIRNGGQQTYLECQVKDESGEYRWYSYIIKAVPADTEHPENFVIFKKDIENVKADEEKQKQILRDALETAKNASAAKGQFLSRMSHEIRTPLNAVIGYMQIGKDSSDNPGKMMHCIENSDMAAKHLLSIINDVLDISSIESGKMKIANEEFDLKGQLTNLSTIFFNQAKDKKVRFEAVLSEVTEEWVIGDSLRLNQILMNLLSNAVKFTPEDGKVTLAVSQKKIDDKKVYMTFAVSDTGIGMSEEYKKKLFTPFEQESATTAQKYGGTGLGLSITFNLVNMMGGSIEVESTQNKGSRFIVSLHFDRSKAEHSVERGGALQQDYSKVHALIVDDDKDSCQYMKALLKRCNVKSDTVYDGETAVKRIKGRMGTDYKYDMCIMDLNMPGMNGLETAEKIKKECDPDIPIIIATAYDVTEYEDQAKKAGISKIIAKPLFQSTMFNLMVSTYGKYEPKKPESRHIESLKGLKVLLAEDNPMNMEIAIDILEKSGLVVDSVTDGKQAADRFIQSQTGTYNAILMDVQMPVMDGYTATGVIRRSTHPEAASIPIIAMTANAFAEDVSAALASGMNGHIAKPVNYEKLYEVLDRFCKVDE